MLAEQNSSYMYWDSEGKPSVTIDLTVRITIPGNPDAHVTIGLLFETEFLGIWEDALRQHLFNGVHRGIASAELPLPVSNISVGVTRLVIVPPLDTMSIQEIPRIGSVVEVLTKEMVAGLWASMEAVQGLGKMSFS